MCLFSVHIKYGFQECLLVKNKKPSLRERQMWAVNCNIPSLDVNASKKKKFAEVQFFPNLYSSSRENVLNERLRQPLLSSKKIREICSSFLLFFHPTAHRKQPHKSASNFPPNTHLWAECKYKKQGCRRVFFKK